MAGRGSAAAQSLSVFHPFFSSLPIPIFQEVTMSVAKQILTPKMSVALPIYNNELLRLDRFTRFLVLATNQAESGFSKFGLIGRATRIALHLGWAVQEAEAEIWRRYQNYLLFFQSRPIDFLNTTEQLRQAYGDDQLRRWQVLVSTE